METYTYAQFTNWLQKEMPVEFIKFKQKVNYHWRGKYFFNKQMTLYNWAANSFPWYSDPGPEYWTKIYNKAWEEQIRREIQRRRKELPPSLGERVGQVTGRASL